MRTTTLSARLHIFSYKFSGSQHLCVAFCVLSGTQKVRAPECAEPIIDLNFMAGSGLDPTHKHLSADDLSGGPPRWARLQSTVTRAAREETEKMCGRRTTCPQVLEGLSRRVRLAAMRQISEPTEAA